MLRKELLGLNGYREKKPWEGRCPQAQVKVGAAVELGHQVQLMWHMDP
jgi:hypothetical protein